MLETVFRRCKQTDLEKIAHIVRQLYASDPAESPGRPDIELTFTEFERHPEKGDVIAFEQDGELVGYAILVFFWSNEFGGDVIEIDELAVDEHHRGRGIGKAFFPWLDAYRSCAGYALQASEKNEPARRLYESVGFVPSRNQYFFKLRS